MIKRSIDVVISGLALFLLSPLVLLIAAMVCITMGRPVLFRQVRPGYLGRPFTVLKFRTMREAFDTQGCLLSDVVRLTRLGCLLRRTSLDEVPQLWCVLKRDMSLVGPRPLLSDYLDRYTPEQARRHLVRPGITGWAQVNGRQDLPFSRRLELDAWYVDHASLALDLKILGLTLFKLFRGSGVRLAQEVAEVDDLGLHPSMRRTAGTDRD